jgi:hypothetical protein
MDKNELLTFLKPLQWVDDGGAFIYAEVESLAWYSININGLSSLGGNGYDIYFTYAIKLHPYQQVNDELIKTCTNMEGAREAAQEHYNNMILKLFVLEKQRKKETEESFEYIYDNFNWQRANMSYWQHINPYSQTGYIYPITFSINLTGITTDD